MCGFERTDWLQSPYSSIINDDAFNRPFRRRLARPRSCALDRFGHCVSQRPFPRGLVVQFAILEKTLRDVRDERVVLSRVSAETCSQRGWTMDARGFGSARRELMERRTLTIELRGEAPLVRFVRRRTGAMGRRRTAQVTIDSLRCRGRSRLVHSVGVVSQTEAPERAARRSARCSVSECQRRAGRVGERAHLTQWYTLVLNFTSGARKGKSSGCQCEQ